MSTAASVCCNFHIVLCYSMTLCFFVCLGVFWSLSGAWARLPSLLILVILAATWCVTKRCGWERKEVIGKQAANRQAHAGNRADPATLADRTQQRWKTLRTNPSQPEQSKATTTHGTIQNEQGHQHRPKWKPVPAAQDCETSRTTASALRPGTPRSLPDPGSKGAHGPPSQREEGQHATATRDTGAESGRPLKGSSGRTGSRGHPAGQAKQGRNGRTQQEACAPWLIATAVPTLRWRDRICERTVTRDVSWKEH
jgi:hypothetical protein